MGLFDRVRDAVGNGGESGRDGGEPVRDGEESPRNGPESDRDGASPGGDRDDHPPTDDAAVLVDEAADTGYELDYSPASLATLDRFLDDPSTDGREADEREVDERETDGRRVAAYLGEVFVRHYDGEWRFVEDEGWLVDLGDVSPDDRELFAAPRAVEAVMDGGTTLAAVHDDVVGGLSVDGPRLSESEDDAAADPADGSLPDESRDGQRELAAELVDHWPGYELDYSPASLAALDDLVADEYDESPGDVDRDARCRESPPGEIPEDASVRVAGGGEAARIAAYLGEVFCRSYRAVWRSDGTFDAVAVAVDSGRAEFQPAPLVSGAFQGHVSFERFHDALADDHGLETDAS